LALAARFSLREESMDTDRNLLFAVLALQAGLLNQDRFLLGCTLWTTRKHIPLADLLIEQGWLTAVDRADIDRLLQRQLLEHHGDVQASFAAVAGPEIQQGLAALHDPDVDRSLTGPYQQTRPQPHATAPAAPATAGKNLLFEEIGRGGMGAVFKGRDTELGRELAVKVLLAEHRQRPELVRRFLEEARIAGQLQHPGVAPVYELGWCLEDQPFFTMKLVKGHTLSELLRQRSGHRQDLGRFLGIFAQVCQTVAYAHARGVLHRDLKPSNVMVGAFGEVQVMDWGLAKVLCPAGQPAPRSDGDDRTVIQTNPPGSTAEESRTGTVVGTPAYMAPEQARGETVDERADVFGLGAILCILLTGQPPFCGDRPQLLHASQQGELDEAFSRLSCCGLDVELVELCMQCLAPAREDRLRHAGLVAERVMAHQAAVEGRLRLAEVERAAATARAVEER
jgi:serine/threonine-protein kinase